MVGRAARLAVARRRVGRAAGLLREARGDLSAAMSDAPDTLGVVHVGSADAAQQAADLIGLLQARYGDVDVVILARSTDEQAPPTAGTPGEGAAHGTSDQRREAGGTARDAGRSEARLGVRSAA